MPKQDTKHRFKSLYGSNYVTDAQYLTEQFCVHVAKQSQEDLIDKFWKLPKWTKFFKQQIVAANKLLKEYSIDSVLEALRDNRSKKVYSLRAPFFKAIVLEYQLKRQLILSLPKILVEVKSGVENTLPRQPYGTPTLLSKLKNLKTKN